MCKNAAHQWACVHICPQGATTRLCLCISSLKGASTYFAALLSADSVAERSLSRVSLCTSFTSSVSSLRHTVPGHTSNCPLLLTFYFFHNNTWEVYSTWLWSPMLSLLASVFTYLSCFASSSLCLSSLTAFFFFNLITEQLTDFKDPCLLCLWCYSWILWNKHSVTFRNSSYMYIISGRPQM